MGSGAVEKEAWGSKVDFVLSCLGYAVGLGNVWRFPYVCGENGGAAFLLPYAVMIVCAGLPSFYLEISLGQFSGLTPLLLYRNMAPIAAGIGYAMIMYSVIASIFYNVIIAWALFYLVASFSGIAAGELPWTHCEEWATDTCWDRKRAANCNSTQDLYFFKGSCQNGSVEVKFHNGSNLVQLVDLRDFWSLNTTSKTLPSKDYLEQRVLKVGGSLGSIGAPQGELVGALAVAWLFIFAALCRGVKSSGKVVWFTATFPYVIMTILLVKGLTLDGAMEGVSFFIGSFDGAKLTTAKPWKEAATQVFFSLSVGGAGLATLSSYNKFHNNAMRDTLIVVVGNGLTSLYAGLAIFSMIGHQALVTGEEVGTVAAGGVALAFHVYPDTLTKLPVAHLWSVLFFFMLFLLGVDSQLVMVEAVVTAVVDEWPTLRRPKAKAVVVATVCALGFAAGIPFVCSYGSTLLDIVNDLSSNALILTALSEVAVVSWVYGFRRFAEDLRLMMGGPTTRLGRLLGYPVSPYYLANWVVVTPLLLAAIQAFAWWDYTAPQDRQTPMPAENAILEWLAYLAIVLLIPAAALFISVYYVGVKKKPLRWLITPTSKWKPNDGSGDKEGGSAKPSTVHPQENIDPRVGSWAIALEPPPQKDSILHTTRF